ncbi:outer membrane protein assembly factor BamE (lipoprotein component of BamABCDE complex) [Dysgonomonas sp. PFB1-18]|uniref:hypothetical protein n=1 Tax=unclassified Dysgonomonas TaxID=2630389 RepID=UPI00247397CA|nr:MULTISPECIES: hypothetical protein [unclassified Dysgonomonas]MDH6309212.1 outer membrane protein assembly factor BamE (lipoprotein component of BamABCDE complex) [Dysgonomonas sp. PF1-14]MDH6338908.1 outer membrane protein assembly factor BamE (lipoprotein component of BamABCDE complex) [Dysgonomonas sp. PF1-16]MDH6380461.1 outer membrane protein assembly factor BamE (lipoprotein component of BamABCDE complex) [Dysgonomonas sp. PFB1-18]MDH6397736.1 outer membrane protein assembly factor Bam
MKKLLFTLFMALALTACGTAYNTQLKQVQLGMTPDQIVNLMGEKYTVVEQRDYNNQTLMYVDKFKNQWYFQFVDGHLYKWYKEKE